MSSPPEITEQLAPDTMMCLWISGNGLSDKPSLLSHRSRWWSIDDCVDKDMPAALKCITGITGASKVHALGHSMVSGIHSFSEG